MTELKNPPTDDVPFSVLLRIHTDDSVSYRVVENRMNATHIGMARLISRALTKLLDELERMTQDRPRTLKEPPHESPSHD